MKDCTIYEKVCFSGIREVFNRLRDFGCEYSLRRICLAIENKNTADLLEYIRDLDNYGSIDILCALCIVVDCADSEIISSWFYNNCLAECSLCELVIKVKERLVVNLFDELDSVCHVDSKTMLFAQISMVQFESYLWDNLYDEDLAEIDRLSKKNIGIWYPGIYSRPIRSDYLRKLEQYAFPVLIQIGRDLKEAKVKRKTEAALIRNSAVFMVSELRISFFPAWI